MSTTKHTPGPWTFAKVVPDKYPSGYQGSVYYAIKANGSRIAQTSGEHLAQDAEDNARLIAEAPALLAALRAIVHELDEYGFINSQDNDPDGEESHAVGTARTAIARAEGRA